MFSIYSEKGVDVTVPENTSTISEPAISLGEDMTVYCLRLQNMRVKDSEGNLSEQSPDRENEMLMESVFLSEAVRKRINLDERRVSIGKLG